MAARAFCPERGREPGQPRPVRRDQEGAPAALDAGLLSALRQRHAQASFAFVVAPATKSLHAITAAGDEPLPELRPGELTYWLDTKDELKRDAHTLGLSTDRFYLAPASGLSTSQYLLARDIGAQPIVGSLRIGPHSPDAPHRFHRGDLIVLTLGSQPRGAAQALGRLLAGLAREGLRSVSFEELLASKR